MLELIKAVSKTGSASVVNILLAVLKTKILAFVLGPNGVGMLSLLDQTTQTANTLANFGGGVAITQGIANKTGRERARYMATVFWILVISSGVAVLFLVVFAEYIAQVVEMRDNVGLIRWLAIPVLLSVPLGYLNGTLSGNYAVGRLAVVAITTSMMITLLAYPTALQVNAGRPVYYIGMVSTALGASVLLALVFTFRGGWLVPLREGLREPFSLDAARHFFRISGTTIFLGLVHTGVFLVLRSELAGEKNYADVGLFDAAWRLSMMYVTLVLGSFASYYMPRLSGMDKDADRQRLIGQVFRLATLLTTPLVIAVIVFKPLVIQILYSSDFLPSLRMMRWMLIGDYLKVAAWVVAMPALAYADMKTYFWTETLWNLGFLGLSLFSLQFMHDLQGVGMAFLVIYSAYLAYYVHYSGIRHTFLRPEMRVIVSWLVGLGLVIGASILSWEDVSMNWMRAIVWMFIGLGYMAFSLNAGERARLADVLVRNRSRFWRKP